MNLGWCCTSASPAGNSEEVPSGWVSMVGLQCWKLHRQGDRSNLWTGSFPSCFAGIWDSHGYLILGNSLNNPAIATSLAVTNQSSKANMPFDKPICPLMPTNRHVCVLVSACICHWAATVRDMSTCLSSCLTVFHSFCTDSVLLVLFMPHHDTMDR